MYVSPGRMVGGAMVGGAGAAAADDTGVLGDGLARTGAPLALLAVLGMVLLVGGFLLLRARLQAAGDGS